VYGQTEKMDSRLLSIGDMDPERWKPLLYSAVADVPVTANGQVRVSIPTNNKPYVWTHFAHTILGNTGDPQTSGLFNDGQYLIQISDELINYTDQAIHADLISGLKVRGQYEKLPYPIYLSGTHSINFSITNIYTRVLTPVSSTFSVQIALRGVCDWGKL
jgi:hypothetical protein